MKFPPEAISKLKEAHTALYEAQGFVSDDAQYGAINDIMLAIDELTEWLKRFNNGGIRALKVNPARESTVRPWHA